MEDIDIKQIWKLSQSEVLKTQVFSIDEIQKFRRQKSRQITRSTRLMILFDIGLKSIILIGFLYVLFLIQPQSPYQYIVGILILILTALIFFNTRFLHLLRVVKETDSVIDNLKKKLLFHKTVYYQFLFINALSSPLFVIVGFFLYEYHKYGQIQMDSPTQDLVPYIFILIAFCFSIFTQRPIYKRQLIELKETIEDLDDLSMAGIRIEVSRKIRRNLLIWFSVFILIGILVLLIFIYH